MYTEHTKSELMKLGIEGKYLDACYEISNEFPKTKKARENLYNSLLDQARSIIKVISELDKQTAKYSELAKMTSYYRWPHLDHMTPTRKSLIQSFNGIMKAVSEFNLCLAEDETISGTLITFAEDDDLNFIKRYFRNVSRRKINFGSKNTKQISGLNSVWATTGKRRSKSSVDGDYLLFLSLCLYGDNSKTEALKKHFSRENQK